MSTYLTLMFANPDNIDTTKPIEHQWKYSEITNDFQCTNVVRQALPECAVATQDGLVGDIVKPFQKDAPEVLERLIERVSNYIKETQGSLRYQETQHLLHLQVILRTSHILIISGSIVALRYA